MDIKVVNQSAYDIAQDQDMVIVGVFDEDTLTGIAKEYDDYMGGVITKRIADGDFKPKLGSSHIEFYTEYDTESKLPVRNVRICLLGLGKQDKFDRHSFKKVAKSAAGELKGRAFGNVLVRITEESQAAFETELDAIRELTLALRTAEYWFDAFKSKKDDPAVFPTTVTMVVNDSTPADYATNAVATANAIGSGMSFTKDLGNTPGNVCTPTWLGEQAQTLANDKTTVTVFGLDEIKNLKMGSFLAVAQGSIEEPKLIVVEYKGGEAGVDPVALVGKGITFDTGGISLKPSSSMDEMKYDMMGAASVLGTIKAIAEMGLKINVVGIIPTCENMPSHNAIKPGDIVTSMSGQTIEILNTDAEGRLILCDALTFAQTMNPEIIIDLATLTGAISVALGSVHSGLFTTDDPLAQGLIDAGYGAMDTVWRMPMDKEFDEMLQSNFADMANIGGGREGGSSSAAAFLARFTEGVRWAHLDIAGTASQGGKAKGATGRPVGLLVQYLINRVTWGLK